jgi:hypothetical protein
MPEAKPKSTQKPKAARSPKRLLVARGLPAAPGVGNIFVVKRGEDLKANLTERLEAMKRDFEKVEFFWSKVIKDPQFSETREYPELSQLMAMWELREGVRNLQEYKGRMKRLKVQVDFFEDGKDYQLTMNEVVEILS